ncbi:MAG: extracellular solute-binding protein [Spirochaetales bacterium]|nr:extracellular solute-binding protein [Spirochaetales bacterium]
MKRKLFCMVCMTFLSCYLFAGGNSESEPVYHGSEGKITFYLSGPEKMVNEIENAFEAKHDGNDVLNVFHSGCGPLRQKVWMEMEAGQIYADVFFGSNPVIFHILKDRGVLHRYISPQEDFLKGEYHDGDGYFPIVNLRYVVLVYHKDLENQDMAPMSYADLLKPEYLGLMAYTDPAQSSTSFAYTSALWELYERSNGFFAGMKENRVLIVPKSKMVADKILSGEIGVGISPFDAVFRGNRIAKKTGMDPVLAIAWPEEGAIRIERPIAIIKNSARPAVNQALAEELIDFMLSEEGQAITAKYGFYPVRENTTVPAGLHMEVENYIGIDWLSVWKSEQEVRAGFTEAMRK